MRGTYGFEYADYLTEQTNPFVFLDIGANQGLYSVLAARNPNCLWVTAFEPVPKTARLLARNLALNAVAKRVSVVEAGISNTESKAIIHIPTGHSGAASLKPSGGGGASERLEVALVNHTRLDQIRMPDAPLIVKIDVEGHEDTVVAELLKSAHARAITSVFFECDTALNDPGQICARLEKSGFTAFRKIGTGQHYDMLAER